MRGSRSKLGLAGERLAETHLRRRGFKTVARRFLTQAGELDLVMTEADTLVFVEVKTQRSRDWSDPEDRVGATKQRRLCKAARWFVSKNKRFGDCPYRFDIVAVTIPEDGEPRIDHHPDAFAPRDW